MLRNGKKFRCEESVTSSPNCPNPIADERNPLLNNQVVLTRLFDFCPLSDLYEYRLVSKEWYFCSLPRIRNEATVRISNSDVGCPFGDLNWTVFHQDFQVVGKQFKGFKLLHVDFLDSPPPSELPGGSVNSRLLKGQDVDIEQMYKNVEQFWGQCGQFIQKLELLLASVYSVQAFKKAIFEELPNLEKLTLWDVKRDTHYYVPPDKDVGRKNDVVNVNCNLKDLCVIHWVKHGCFPISWSLLFEHFPNIQKLKLNVDPHSGDHVAPLVTKLELQSEILLKALTLAISYRWQSTSLQLLLQLPKLKLASLELILEIKKFVEEDRKILRKALIFHGDTLEYLHVHTCCHMLEYDELEPMNNFPFRLESLQKLTHLELRGCLCSNFHFLQRTPNLKILRLCWNRYIKILDDADLELMRDTKLLFLQEFYFHSKKPITGEIMTRFVKMMPNVERFYSFIDSRAFGVVCEHWKNLTVLVIEDVWNKGRLSGVDYVGDEAIAGFVAGYEERRPNITNLHDLKELKIMSTGKISDASIWNGFLKLPKLSTLRITVSRKTSNRALDALMKKFPGGKCSLDGPLACEYRICC